MFGCTFSSALIELLCTNNLTIYPIMIDKITKKKLLKNIDNDYLNYRQVIEKLPTDLENELTLDIVKRYRLSNPYKDNKSPFVYLDEIDTNFSKIVDHYPKFITNQDIDTIIKKCKLEDNLAIVHNNNFIIESILVDFFFINFSLIICCLRILI